MTRSLFETPPAQRSAGWRPRLAVCYSWFFAVSTLLALAAILVSRVDSISSGTSAIFGWSAFGSASPERHAGWLINFDGAYGYTLALVELIVIAAAIVASCLRLTVVRQAGLMILLAWSALWTAGAARQLVATGHWESGGYTLACALALAATHVRTRRRWLLDEHPRTRRLKRAVPA